MVSGELKSVYGISYMVYRKEKGMCIALCILSLFHDIRHTTYDIQKCPEAILELKQKRKESIVKR